MLVAGARLRNSPVRDWITRQKNPVVFAGNRDLLEAVMDDGNAIPGLTDPLKNPPKRPIHSA